MNNTQEEHETGKQDNPKDSLHDVNDIISHIGQIGRTKDTECNIDIGKYIAGLGDTIEIIVSIVGYSGCRRDEGHA